ncbi:MAG: hypothetical protein U0821_03090 [Chloroflexota bacterium]
MSTTHQQRPGTGQVFGVGITVGMLLGIAAGSVLTFLFARGPLRLARRLRRRMSRRGDRVDFELLLQ